MRRTLVAAVAAVLVAASSVAAHPKDSSAIAALEGRVAALEARVAALEDQWLPSPSPAPTAPSATPSASPTPTPSPSPSPSPTSAPTLPPSPSPSPSATSCTTTVGATGSIQTAINGAASGATVCLTAGATYTTTSAITIIDKTGLTLDGRGATIRASGYFTNGAAEIIYAAGGSNLTFRDLTIIGTDPTRGYSSSQGEFQAGIGLVGVQGALVERVTTRNTQGDGIGVYSRAGTPGRDITIRDNTIVAAGRWGVTLTHAERVTITGNTVTDTDKAFELEGDDGGDFVRDVLIADNAMTGIGYNLFAAYGPGPFTRVTVERNTVTGTSNRGIWSYIEPTGTARASTLIFRDNSGTQAFWEDPCSTPCRAVLRIYRTDGATVTGNSQPVTSGAGMAGVLAESSTGLSVSGNSFAGSTAELEVR